MIDSPLHAKYFGRQDPDLYGGRVAGRSADGYPILGDVAPHLTQGEMEALPLYANFKARWFKLWEPADFDLFCRVMDHAYNGEFFVKKRIDVPVADHPADEPGGSLKVWLEWIQVEARAPARPVAFLPADGASAHVPLAPGG